MKMPCGHLVYISRAKGSYDNALKQEGLDVRVDDLTRFLI